MSVKHHKLCGLVLAAAVVLGTTQAQGSLIEKAWQGLVFTGFSTQLQRNYFGDGWDFQFAQNFNAREFDFGTTELILNGTMLGTVSTTNRGIPEIEFSLNTSAGGLAYTLLADSGLTKTQIDNGQLNINQKLKINKFGFYTLDLTINSRGDVETDGSTENLDFDVGPIHVEGHILIDLINCILDLDLPGGAPDMTLLLGDFQANPNVLGQDDRQSDPKPDSVAIVPEPSSIILLLFAGTGMVVFRRYRF